MLFERFFRSILGFTSGLKSSSSNSKSDDLKTGNIIPEKPFPESIPNSLRFLFCGKWCYHLYIFLMRRIEINHLFTLILDGWHEEEFM